jgi:hypothetical protein
MSDIVHVIKSTVNPSAAPTRQGQHWINTVLKTAYISVGTASVNDWVLDTPILTADKAKLDSILIGPYFLAEDLNFNDFTRII